MIALKEALRDHSDGPFVSEITKVLKVSALKEHKQQYLAGCLDSRRPYSHVKMSRHESRDI